MKSTIMAITAILMMIILASVIYAPCGDEGEECSPEELSNNPEYIDADNWANVDAGQMTADKLERAAISAEDIMEKGTQEQAEKYRNANQPITDPTEKELALLSKIPEYKNMDTDSFKDSGLQIDGNTITSDDTTIIIPEGTNPSISRNADDSISIGNDLKIYSGTITDNGDGHVTLGPGSDFTIRDSTRITSAGGLDLYDTEQIPDAPDQPNSIRYGPGILHVNIANNNRMTIDNHAGNAFQTLHVAAIEDDSTLDYAETHPDGTISKAAFTKKGTSFQNREALEANIFDDLAYGDHTLVVTPEECHHCSSPCVQVGSSQLPRNFDHSGATYITNADKVNIYPANGDAQIVVTEYVTTDLTNKMYYVQYAGMDTPLLLSENDFNLLNEGGTATINGEFTTVRPVLQDLAMTYQYNPEGESYTTDGFGHTVFPLSRSMKEFRQIIAVIDNQNDQMTAQNSRIASTVAHAKPDPLKQILEEWREEHPEEPAYQEPTEAIITEPERGEERRINEHGIDTTKIKYSGPDPTRGRYFYDPINRPGRYVIVVRSCGTCNDWQDPSGEPPPLPQN